MELREWQYISKPAGSTTNNSSSGYKKRFEKLIKYHIDHASSELESITHKEINDYSFRLGEHYNTGKNEFDRSIIVSVDENIYDNTLSTFYLSVFIDKKEVLDLQCKGYESFLVEVGAYMNIPDEATEEYEDLLIESLTEWKQMNPTANNSSQPASTTSSKTNKEKFAELVAYMQKHKDSSVIFTSVNRPNDTGFEYEEQRAFTNGDEYNMSLEVECKSGNLFFIHLDLNGKRIATKSAVGWEDLLLKIKTHFHVPKTGSPEYISLTESFSSELREWKYINPPQPTTSKNPYTRDQAYRYNRLLDQITSDGIAKYKLHKITNNTLDITVDTSKRKDLNIRMEYQPTTDDYILTIDGKTSKGWAWLEGILELLTIGGVIKNTNLCESAGSIADEFKLYENLF